MHAISKTDDNSNCCISHGLVRPRTFGCVFANFCTLLVESSYKTNVSFIEENAFHLINCDTMCFMLF